MIHSHTYAHAFELTNEHAPPKNLIRMEKSHAAAEAATRQIYCLIVCKLLFAARIQFDVLCALSFAAQTK